jgi:hypothetical protein
VTDVAEIGATPVIWRTTAVAFGWSRLWRVLPDTARAELTTAHSAFAAAVATGMLAVSDLLPTGWWWPGRLGRRELGVTGWARARAAVADLSTLTEAAVDLHGRALAVAVGAADPESTGPLTVAEGERAIAIIRRGRCTFLVLGVALLVLLP